MMSSYKSGSYSQYIKGHIQTLKYRLGALLPAQNVKSNYGKASKIAGSFNRHSTFSGKRKMIERLIKELERSAGLGELDYAMNRKKVQA